MDLSTKYSLERYHINGSRILSRSFHVGPWKPEDAQEKESADDSDDESEKDEEDPADVGMTPLADLLNARFGCNNVRYCFMICKARRS